MKLIKEIIKPEIVEPTVDRFIGDIIECVRNRKVNKFPKHILKHIHNVLDTESSMKEINTKSRKDNILIFIIMITVTIWTVYTNQTFNELFSDYWYLFAIGLAGIHSVFQAICTFKHGVDKVKQWKEQQCSLLIKFISETPEKYLVHENNTWMINFDMFLESDEYKKYGLYSIEKEHKEYIFNKINAYSKLSTYFNLKYELPVNYKYKCIYELDNMGKPIKQTYEEEAL